MPSINEFKGEYRFLSNFWYSTIEFEGLVYPTVEHAYQAAKCLSIDTFTYSLPNLEDGTAQFITKNTRAFIQKLKTPGDAKRFGKTVKLRPDWEEIKLFIMEELIRKKFEHPELKEKLLSTDDSELIEGNYWNDNFWGICNSVGDNHLGKILMKVRDEIRSLTQ